MRKYIRVQLAALITPNHIVTGLAKLSHIAPIPPAPKGWDKVGTDTPQ